MSELLQKRDPIIIDGRMIVPYKYSVGSTGSKFMVALRDKKKIMAIRCPTCDSVYLPPRAVCSKCFGRLDEWVELDGKGTLLNYTVVHYSLPIHPTKPPFAYGVIRLDGSDTGFTHILGEVDVSDIHIGMRMEPVFREERKGNILDIRYFRPILL